MRLSILLCIYLGSIYRVRNNVVRGKRLSLLVHKILVRTDYTLCSVVIKIPGLSASTVMVRRVGDMVRLVGNNAVAVLLLSLLVTCAVAEAKFRDDSREVPEGSTLLIHCFAPYSRIGKVTWVSVANQTTLTIENRVVVHDPRVSAEIRPFPRSEGDSERYPEPQNRSMYVITLKIHDVRKSDAGWYACYGMGGVIQKHLIDVTDPEPTTPSPTFAPLPNITANIGDDVTFVCSARNALSVTWYRVEPDANVLFVGNHRWTTDERFQTSTMEDPRDDGNSVSGLIYSLHINAVQTKDQGKYSCLADFSYGYIFQDSTLLIVNNGSTTQTDPTTTEMQDLTTETVPFTESSIHDRGSKSHQHRNLEMNDQSAANCVSFPWILLLISLCVWYLCSC